MRVLFSFFVGFGFVIHPIVLAGACPTINPGGNVVSLECMREAKHYFLFTLICSKNKTCKVHGLWPQLSPNEYPMNCSTVKNISDDIYQQYSNIMIRNKKMKWFMDHEYSKHGSCTLKEGNAVSAQEYFALIHDLYQKYMNPYSLDKKYLYSLGKNSPAVCLDTQFQLMECPVKVGNPKQK